MKNKRALCALVLGILFWLGLSTIGVWANSYQQMEADFQSANTDYREGLFLDAAEGYRRLLEQEFESTAVYYNLGNALFKSGRKGEALWAYLRAQRLAPRDGDLRANLEYLRSELTPGTESRMPLAPVLRLLAADGRLATRELATALAVLLWLATLTWIADHWMPALRRLIRPAAGAASISTAILALMLMLQFFAIDRVPYAVTIKDNVQVRFAPVLQATAHYVLPEGSMVRVLGQEDGWLRVRRKDGLLGWVSPGEAKLLRDPS